MSDIGFQGGQIWEKMVNFAYWGFHTVAYNSNKFVNGLG